MAPSGRLVRLAQAAAAADESPSTLAPTPETLAAWQEISPRRRSTSPAGPRPTAPAAGLTALKTAAGTPAHQILRSPFVPFDMPGLLGPTSAARSTPSSARGADDLQTDPRRRPAGSHPRCSPPGPSTAPASPASASTAPSASCSRPKRSGPGSSG